MCNAVSRDELGNWCQQMLMKALQKCKAQEGGFHGNPVCKNHPCKRPSASSVTLEELQQRYLPHPIPTLSCTLIKFAK